MNLIERGAFERIVARLAPGSRLLRARPLAGGVSAQVTALTFAAPDGAERTVVVRRYGPADLASNPHVAATEVAVLHHVYAAGLPVPQPFFADETGTLFPTPYSVIDYIRDAAELPRAEWPAALPQLAGFLAALHRLPVDAL